MKRIENIKLEISGKKKEQNAIDNDKARNIENVTNQ